RTSVPARRGARPRRGAEALSDAPVGRRHSRLPARALTRAAIWRAAGCAGAGDQPRGLSDAQRRTLARCDADQKAAPPCIVFFYLDFYRDGLYL
ncbi:MAG: hypothetical protein WAN35_10900, partial [Terracidiphilus sp.]